MQLWNAPCFIFWEYHEKALRYIYNVMGQSASVVLPVPTDNFDNSLSKPPDDLGLAGIADVVDATQATALVDRAALFTGIHSATQKVAALMTGSEFDISHPDVVAFTMLTQAYLANPFDEEAPSDEPPPDNHAQDDGSYWICLVVVLASSSRCAQHVKPCIVTYWRAAIVRHCRC